MAACATPSRCSTRCSPTRAIGSPLEAVREAVGLADDAAISRPARRLPGRRRAGRPRPDRGAGRRRPRHGARWPPRPRARPGAGCCARRRRPARSRDAWRPSCAPWPRRPGSAPARVAARLAMELLAVEPASPEPLPRSRPPQPAAAAAAGRSPRRPIRRRRPSRSPSRRAAPAEPAAAVARPPRRARGRAGARARGRAGDRVDRCPPPDGVAGIRARWAEVVASASPATQAAADASAGPWRCDGARLTLAFPEERGFMREKVTNRAGSIEQLLDHRAGRAAGRSIASPATSSSSRSPCSRRWLRIRRSGRPGPAGGRPAHHRRRAGRRAGGPLISFHIHAARSGRHRTRELRGIREHRSDRQDGAADAGADGAGAGGARARRRWRPPPAGERSASSSPARRRCAPSRSTRRPWTPPRSRCSRT